MAEIPTPTGTTGTKSRPLGVTILAILMILGGILNLAGLATSYGIYDMAWTGIAGVIGLILGIAMWQLIPWARKAALLWYIISLIMTIVITFLVVIPIIALIPGMAGLAMSIAMIAILPSLVITLIIILYLNSGGVKAAFEGVGGW